MPYRWPKPKGRKLVSRKAAASRRKMMDDDALMAQSAEQLQSRNEYEQLQLQLPNLSKKVILEGTCIHAVNGVELVADADGVAYWPAEETLLVADLHLEKGSSFARRGQLLPPYDTQTTLRRLSHSLNKWCPKRVIALGDSFHDPDASARLSSEALETLSEFMKGRDWVWITGNHDPEPPTGLGGDVLEELHSDRLILRHIPQVGATSGEIAGHLHPKARLVKRGRQIRKSCFAASRDRMILPSFGAYTGGLSIFDPAFDGLFDGRNFYALMRGDQKVYRILAGDLK